MRTPRPLIQLDRRDVEGEAYVAGPRHGRLGGSTQQLIGQYADEAGILGYGNES
jgi:hypothetical protein